MPGFLSDPVAAIRDLLPRLTALMTVVSLVWAVVAGLGGSTPPAPEPDDDVPGAELPDYQQPPLEVQEELETIRTDLIQAVLELRHGEGVPPVVTDGNLQIGAQHWAERNAVLGREDNSPANVAMVQAHLPIEQASGHTLLDQWLHSGPHTAVLIDPAHTVRGVGLAHGHGQVWAVVQFSA
ncbi:CAP domain-containing protein [Corynebacterium halotolerans]|uniref:SCP domain-containing protein n=1 Tax=Corynebacterium halotolerans YIM 70093 = DSM 44683 TaxID=1121362 RepID=M1NUZ5_9CORY|nr:CAP domain-containing protein [Corynebacterium halotolerans]AGF73317.1 hypothetical protein A605_11595 [Corynebacterium halotolerans YIM 70093 = DSM 44683]